MSTPGTRRVALVVVLALAGGCSKSKRGEPTDVERAQLDIKPKGHAPEPEPAPAPDAGPLVVSVLLDAQGIRLGVMGGPPPERLGAVDAAGLGRLAAVLDALSKLPGRAAGRSLELAARSGDAAVPYQSVISVMDVAQAHGFADIGLVDPGQLSVHFAP